jgi:peroxiredoxin/uncharacterized membrane protein YphA (DoxX/SURF4 family)
LDIVLLTARCVLASVFLLAGIAKLHDYHGTRRALSEFGVRDGLNPFLAVGLPLAELSAAIMLLNIVMARDGALLSGLLLGTFEVAIAANLLRGKTPDCHCFGQIASRPLSWSLFGRNLVLLALAALVFTSGPGTGAFGWLSMFTTGEAVNLLFISGLLLLVILGFRSIRRVAMEQSQILAKLDSIQVLLAQDAGQTAPGQHLQVTAPGDGLPVGVSAPAFAIASTEESTVSLADLVARGKWTLLIFVSPNCMACRELLPLIKRWQTEHRRDLTIAVISKGLPGDVLDKLAAYQIENLLLQGASGVAETYLAPWSPAGVLIDIRGKIASPVRAGTEAIRSLVAHTVTVTARNSDVGPSFIPEIALGNSLFKVGDAAPRFTLSNLEGTRVAFDQLLGRSNLFLFWAASCPHCQQMESTLTGWAEYASRGAAQLVVLASGERSQIAERLGQIDSVVLLDTDFRVGPLYGITNAPSAILIDKEGRIASSIGSGAAYIADLGGLTALGPQLVGALNT